MAHPTDPTDFPSLSAATPECSPTAQCYQAVTQTYSKLRQSGASDKVAFKAAERVYAWHHPEVPTESVPYVIAGWLP